MQVMHSLYQLIFSTTKITGGKTIYALVEKKLCLIISDFCLIEKEFNLNLMVQGNFLTFHFSMQYRMCVPPISPVMTCKERNNLGLICASLDCVS